MIIEKKHREDEKLYLKQHKNQRAIRNLFAGITLHLENARRKAYRAKPAGLGTNKVAKLPTDDGAVSIRVFLDHHLVPDSHLVRAFRQQYFQILDPIHPRRNRFRLNKRLFEAMRLVGAGLPLRRWQTEQAFPFQLPKRTQTPGTLLLATMVKEAEAFTEMIRQLRPMGDLTPNEYGTDVIDGIRLRQLPLDLILSVLDSHQLPSI